jgi:RNA polymerase sigma-70 factor (ECF subfamily)
MLVRAVFAGDQTAYEKLYDRYAPLIRAICCDETGNLADAQDLAQDVFMRAYKNLYNLRDPDRFGRWLVGIARLRCREWRRRDSRRRNADIQLNNVRPITPDPQDNGRLKRLRDTISMLPEKERMALHAFYLQEQSAEDARRTIGLSRSGFYRALERARKQLAILLVQQREDIP